MTQAARDPVAGRTASRIAAVDVARGAALVGMFVYHLTWDLGFFQLIDGDIPLSWGFHLYAHAVASLFLLLVGVSLVLADRRGMDWGAYAERLVWIVACAAAISLATMFLFPRAFIFFGILHCIALVSVAALPFLRVPIWLGALVAVVCLAAPSLFASTAFDRPGLWWTGLGTKPPMTYDFRPFFPSAGIALIGLIAARFVLPRIEAAAWLGWTPRRPLGRSIAWAGRHSLLVYMLHQPLFLAALFVVFQISGPSREIEERPFLRACQNHCLTGGAAVRTCAAICRCIVDGSRSSGFWDEVIADKLSGEDRGRFDRLRSNCVRSPAPGAQPSPPTVE